MSSDLQGLKEKPTRRRVEAYRAYWDLDDRHGGVVLIEDDGQRWHHQVSTPQELAMMVDLLRNEQPVYWDTRRSFLQTGPEDVGEDDDDG